MLYYNICFRDRAIADAINKRYLNFNKDLVKNVEVSGDEFKKKHTFT